jgi:hypothetical protein
MGEVMGEERIVRQLHRDGVPAIGRTPWNKSYVRRILRNPAVIGRFQPYLLVRGKRVPDGEPIEGYYPAVVDPDLFYRVQAAMDARRISGGGRKGPHLTNLFSKLLRCGYCGGKMYVINKGKHRDRWLICNNALTGAGCRRLPWRYSSFETSNISFLGEIDLRALMQNVTEAKRGLHLRDRLREAKGRLAEAERKRENVFECITDGKPTDYLRNKLREADQAVADHQATVSRLSAEERSLEAKNMAFAAGQRATPELISKFQASDEQSYKLRSALAARLTDLIEEIRLYPGGMFDKKGKSVSLPSKDDVFKPTPLPAGFKSQRRFAKEQRAYVIRFKDGSVRIVRPDSRKPDFTVAIGGSPVGEISIRRSKLHS